MKTQFNKFQHNVFVKHFVKCFGKDIVSKHIKLVVLNNIVCSLFWEVAAFQFLCFLVLVLVFNVFATLYLEEAICCTVTNMLM